jgi:hypothetical protein
VEVVIITSLAGGTGAGMFLDVAYMVQDVIRSHPTLSNLATKYVSLIAVMPTAFESVESGKTYKKFQQNAYAALLELEHYGTQRTGDDMFLGRMKEAKKDRNRVGFVAPWKPKPHQFIEGQGWEVCYLIDNVNPHRQAVPLTLGETYQMMADYLFLDFEQSAFAIQKRSNRCNLSQWQNDMIGAWVRNSSISDSQGGSLANKDVDVVFATRNGCAFSSFGLSDVSFSRERVYRAAGYLLASRLVLERWLGDEKEWAKSVYQDCVREDFYESPGTPTFEGENLLAHLYHGEKNDWYREALADCGNLQSIPCADGSRQLRAVEGKHRQLLQDAPTPGRARQTLAENAAALMDLTRRLPPLHLRIHDGARRRANLLGVAPTRELLNYYRGTTGAVSKKLTAEDGGDGMRRLEEADTVYFPAKGMSQRIEFPRACATTQKLILGGYRAKAKPFVDKIMAKIREFIGEKDTHRPADLDRYGTLNEYFKKASDQLSELGTRLRQRFEEFSKEQGNDRSQLLSPTTWTEKTYKDQINRRLEASPLVGARQQGSGFSWERFEERFFDQLRKDQPHEFDSNVNTLTSLLDRWFERRQHGPEAIAAIAETLATACRNLLVQIGLDLQEYHDGCVIDLLWIEYSPAERANRLAKFIRASTPYFPMNLHDQAVMTNNYQPTFNNLIGLQQGTIPATSEQNKAALVTQVEGIAQQVEAGTGVLAELVGERSSMVLCREVWGVPLQYYAYLDILHGAYMERGANVDECHINSYECWEDLPDVRAISPKTYEHISGNVETAIFSMMIGTITYRQDGSYIVRVPNRVTRTSMDVHRLGKRISRIIKKVCEEDDIRAYLLSNQDRWERDATPKDWALVYASALWTWEYTRIEYCESTAKDLSPLRNCIASLLKRFERRLGASDEGRQWLSHLACADPEDAAAQAKWTALFDELINQKRILFRPSEAVPLWEVDKTKRDLLQLPPSPTASPPAAPPR